MNPHIPKIRVGAAVQREKGEPAPPRRVKANRSEFDAFLLAGGSNSYHSVFYYEYEPQYCIMCWKFQKIRSRREAPDERRWRIQPYGVSVLALRRTYRVQTAATSRHPDVATTISAGGTAYIFIAVHDHPLEIDCGSKSDVEPPDGGRHVCYWKWWIPFCGSEGEIFFSFTILMSEMTFKTNHWASRKRFHT